MKKLIILSMLGLGASFSLCAGDNKPEGLVEWLAAKGLITYTIGFCATLPQEKIVRCICPEEKSYNLVRYTTTNKEIVRGIYDVLKDCVAQRATVHALVQCKDNYALVIRHTAHKQLMKPTSLAIKLLDQGTYECLYRLIAAEIHKQEKLVFLRSWVPASNDPADQPKSTSIDRLKQIAAKIGFRRAYIKIRENVLPRELNNAIC